MSKSLLAAETEQRADRAQRPLRRAEIAVGAALLASVFVGAALFAFAERAVALSASDVPNAAILALFGVGLAVGAAAAVMLRRHAGALRRVLDLAEAIDAGAPAPTLRDGVVSGELGRLAQRLVAIQETASINSRVRSAIEQTDVAVLVVRADAALQMRNAAFATIVAENGDHFGQSEIVDAEDFDTAFDVQAFFDAAGVTLEAAADATDKISLRVDRRPNYFDVRIAPVRDASETVQALFIEVYDVSGEVFIEDQVGGLVSSFGAGDIYSRIQKPADGALIRNDFLIRIGDDMNALLDKLASLFAEIEGAVTAMSAGDLTFKMTGGYQGDFGMLADSLNTSIDQFESAIKKIAGVSVAVAKSSDVVDDVARELSERVERQAAALEETSATMEQMAASLRESADNAGKASALTVQTADKARDGQEIVKNANEAMARIEASSSKISEITGVIESIAFQTNLLALNAAVEAARAGEAGQGFSVVAAEVRALAQRSSEAAKGIKELIDESVAQVGDGAELVSTAGAALEEIVAGVSSVRETIAEISTLSEEQATGVGTVTASVGELDEITQHNASVAQMCANSSRELKSHVEELSTQVQFFIISEDESDAAAFSDAA